MVDPSAFRVLFESVPDCYLVLDPSFMIVAVSDAYVKATKTTRDGIVGRPLFEVFPDNPDDPEADGVAKLRASLHRVLDRREPDVMVTQKYDIRRPANEGGGFEERHWSPMNSPVFGPDGSVVYIIHRVQDVTDRVRRESEANRIIRELSTPVVRVHKGILLMALVGVVDTIRAEQIVETVLTRIVEENARALILDVAGVPMIDTAVADSLIKTSKAVRLLGAQTILTGIGASAAKTMVSLGIDVSTMQTCNLLADGIQVAMKLVERGRHIS